jgi:hypothetical protein
MCGWHLYNILYWGYPILAAGVHRLQDNQHFVLVFGIEQLLQPLQLGIELGRAHLALLLVALKAAFVIGVPLGQGDGGVGLHAVVIHRCFL